jgi:outer membrane protein assembly factor BamB
VTRRAWRVSRIAVLAAAAVAASALASPDGRSGAGPRSLEMLATLEPADGLGTVVGGWGDAWMDARWSQRLLRLDGRTGRVVARIPVDGRVALAAGAGAVWALQSGGGYARSLHGPLLRIDPATNRVTARIPLRDLADERVVGFGVLAARGSVWVWGPRDLLRIDPRRDRVVQAFAVGDERGELTGAALGRGHVFATTADGHLVRFDARTGAELSAVRLPLRDPALRRARRGDLLLSARGHLAAVDALTGRLAWRRDIGYRIGAVLEIDGVLWADGAATEDSGDRLWALDPATGAAVNSVVLPAFGTIAMAEVDGALWITTAGGEVLVLSRWLARWLRWT